MTLSREVRLFWSYRAHRSPAAILYFSNKYLNLLSTIANILIYAPQSDEVSVNILFMYSSTDAIPQQRRGASPVREPPMILFDSVHQWSQLHQDRHYGVDDGVFICHPTCRCVAFIVPSGCVYLTETSVAVFNGLRVYALTQRSWLSVSVFFLSSVQFITNMVCRLGPRLIDTRS